MRKNPLPLSRNGKHLKSHQIYEHLRFRCLEMESWNAGARDRRLRTHWPQAHAHSVPLLKLKGFLPNTVHF